MEMMQRLGKAESVDPSKIRSWSQKLHVALKRTGVKVMAMTTCLSLIH